MPISKPAYYFSVVSSLLIAFASYRFIFLDLNLAFADMADHIVNRRVILMAHISAAPIALVLGIINLAGRARSMRPLLHRWCGRFYVLSVLLGGLSGLGLAYNAIGGNVAAFGFGLLSLLWIFTTFNALRLARAGNYIAHRRWMIYSFALTFAAVTLRLYLPLFFILANMNYAQTSVWVAWLCWVPNIILAHWWLSRNGVKIST